MDDATPTEPLGAASILDHLADGVLVVRGGRVAWASAPAEEILGRPARRLVGEPITALLPGAEGAVARVEAGQASATARIRLPRHVDPWLVTFSSGRGPGELLATLGRGADPKEQRVKEEVRARLGELSALAAGVAHEVKNPLATVRGAAQLLRVGATPEELDELCRLIIREIDRVDALVRRFMDLSRPARLHRDAVDVNAILHDEVDAERQITRGQGPCWELDLDPSLPRVEGDGERLREALTNLLRNAKEAANRRIRVRTRVASAGRLVEGGTDRGTLLRVEVEDDGPGVPTERRSMLFVPFATTKAEGNGLGLFVARRVVDDHGGALFLDEEPAEGARFVVLLRERLAGR